MTQRSRVSWAASAFAQRSVVLVLLLLGVRAYEFFATRSGHVIPAGIAHIVARGLLEDVAFATIVSLALAVPLIAIALRWPRAAAILHGGVIVAVTLAAVGLSRFFSITMVPLGADFWGYSASELVETSAASAGGWSAVIPFIVAVIIAVTILLAVGRVRMARRALAAAAVAGMLVTVLTVPFGPRPSEFADESGYFMALSKPAWFAARSVGYAAEALTTPAQTYSEYPLLATPHAEDILGPMLAPAGRPPNLVFVIVEGLGRDFVGAGAEYGGFTPFLDSLSAQGLFWDNFLSNAGRTFGVLPSMFGSLPFGRSGFMGLGENMPAHWSLVRWVGANGYATGYYTGTSGSFDGIDAFMERQNIGRFFDQTSFPATIPKQPGGQGGFSWGYADRDLFGYSLEQMGAGTPEPRLDIYLTITTHEPFIPPNADRYRAAYRERLAALSLSRERRATYEAYPDVFATLLYLDDAVAFFLREYRKRPEFGRTIFVITGDHRLVPIPFSTALSRYRVPFIVWSPLVKAPRRMSSVSSHLDVTPTFATYLARNYGLPMPTQVPWIGSGIDSASAFRNRHRIPLMRTKNELDDFIDGAHLLSGDRLFEISPTLALNPVDNASLRDSLKRELVAFRRLNRYVTSGEHIYPETAEDKAARRERLSDDSVVASLGLGNRTPEEQLRVAREYASRRDFAPARALLRRLLRRIPSYHDARALLGRTYAWENDFGEAQAIFEELAQRAPAYLDGWLGRIDLDIWQNRAPEARARADSAIARFGANADLLFAKARALEIGGRRAEALKALDDALRLNPSLPGAADVRARLLR